GRQDVRRGLHARLLRVRQAPEARLPRPVRCQPAREWYSRDGRGPSCSGGCSASRKRTFARAASKPRLQYQVERGERSELLRVRTLPVAVRCLHDSPKLLRFARNLPDRSFERSLVMYRRFAAFALAAAITPLAAAVDFRIETKVYSGK